jgi:thiazole/oxazole-forming peptide maturase SagC family component
MRIKMDNLRIKQSDFLTLRDFDIIRDDDKLLLKESNNYIISISGKYIYDLIPKLIPKLDGSTRVKEIINSLNGFDEGTVFSILEDLLKYNIIEVTKRPRKGDLTEKEIERYLNQLKFFAHKKTEDCYSQQTRLKKSQVTIIGDKEFLESIVRNLIRSGIGMIRYFYNIRNIKAIEDISLENYPSGKIVGIGLDINRLEKIFEKNADFLIVADRDLKKDEINKINKMALKKSVPWISFSDFGQKEIIVGPMIIPYKTPCYECYQLRKESNYNYFRELRLFQKENNYIRTKISTKSAYLYPFIGIISSFISIEVMKYLTQFTTPITQGRIFTINWLTMETRVHRILKIPRCSVCGVKESAPFAVWQEPFKE